MGQEEGPLSPTEILELEYELEAESSTGLVLSAHQLPPPTCYDLKSLEWDSKTTLVLSNTRELDRVSSTK